MLAHAKQTLRGGKAQVGDVQDLFHRLTGRLLFTRDVDNRIMLRACRFDADQPGLEFDQLDTSSQHGQRQTYRPAA